MTAYRWGATQWLSLDEIDVGERCIGGVLTFGRRRFAELAAIGRGRQRDEVTAQYQPSREPSPESST